MHDLRRIVCSRSRTSADSPAEWNVSETLSGPLGGIHLGSRLGGPSGGDNFSQAVVMIVCPEKVQLSRQRIEIGREDRLIADSELRHFSGSESATLLNRWDLGFAMPRCPLPAKQGPSHSVDPQWS